MGRPQWLPDVVAGLWIAEQLTRLDGTVGQHVPAVFEAYARVLHPPHTMTGEPGTWAQVCARTDTIAHPLMQWPTISRTHDVPAVGGGVTRRSAWFGSPPEPGNLPAAALAALLDVLSESTGDQQCVFALWEGLGWVDGRGAWYQRRDADGTVIEEGEPPSAFPLEVLDGPRLRLPGRDYLLFAGPLADATGLGDPRGVWPQSPNLFWPQDRAWCVATEIDFDSTLIGGSQALIDSVLTHPGLEAWPVSPEDSLAWDADLING
ncbi:hypothetical protein [Pseudonocardia sp. WMMC193]|uniref:hypothetical protein n=1 Tax=Pseudonocardia sp. WMMC193 TaxID=2911965 RepID=UPI001F3B9677|nr:hypothetical protein [Pseudonocardia sp. WMMC193]MCF7547323.1 hypothetical protein [Pseudonocardia sp. WMMC193]